MITIIIEPGKDVRVMHNWADIGRVMVLDRRRKPGFVARPREVAHIPKAEQEDFLASHLAIGYEDRT